MKKKLILLTLILLRLLSGFSQPIKVSENGRHLLNMDDVPFFWLGDTVWELFHRLDRDEVSLYFGNRSEKGFNIIQAVILYELESFESPNACQDFPLIDGDISRPDTTAGNHPDDPGAYDYWDHVDYIAEQAKQHGIILGLLPCWGEYVTPRFRERTISTVQQGYEYGEGEMTGCCYWMTRQLNLEFQENYKFIYRWFNIHLINQSVF